MTASANTNKKKKNLYGGKNYAWEGFPLDHVGHVYSAELKLNTMRRNLLFLIQFFYPNLSVLNRNGRLIHEYWVHYFTEDKAAGSASWPLLRI